MMSLDDNLSNQSWIIAHRVNRGSTVVTLALVPWGLIIGKMAP